MKKIITAALVMLSCTSFADKGEAVVKSKAKVDHCSSEAVAIAKMNLDQKAAKYGHRESSVTSSTFVSSSEAEFGEVLSKYESEGYIYKGTYLIEMTLDSSCSVNSVLIREKLTE
jgi:hypothetical protein